MCKSLTKSLIVLFILVSNFIWAQSQEDYCRIKINDSLVVNPGDYVLDKNKKIDILRIKLDSTNIKRIYTIKNPCSQNQSTYLGAYVIDRKVKFPILNLSEYVSQLKIENKEFKTYKVVFNGQAIDDITDCFIEITNKTEINIIKDNFREPKITVVFLQK